MSADDGNNKVLVTCATGKAGYNTCLALAQAGFEVFGTTRTEASGARLAKIGVIPTVCDYTKDLDRALAETGAKKMIFITDYFLAARKSVEREYEHGKHAVDAAKRAGVTHAIFVSVADGERFPPECRHILAKPMVERYLAAESEIKYHSVLGVTTFFENLDDNANWNPLKKGRVKFLMDEEIKWCATYDIGRAAAVQFKAPQEWHAKKLDVISWKGDLKAVAAALEKVGGVPVSYGLAMPIFARRLFLNDVHHMCLFFADPGIAGEPEDFKKFVPGALDAEGWFHFYNRYANGEAIVPKGI